MLLWDCASVHRKPSMLEWIRTAHPECHVLFVPGGYTAKVQLADILIQQPLKRDVKEQPMLFFAESVCQDDAVLDLRLGALKRLMAQWVIHACAEVEKKTRITTKAWRHLSWTFEETPLLAARCTREFLNGTLFEEETELAKDEPEDLILHDDDDDAEDEAHADHDVADVVPERTGTAVASRALWLPKSHSQNAFCICAARTAGTDPGGGCSWRVLGRWLSLVPATSLGLCIFYCW